jgi:hypothetical protein
VDSGFDQNESILGIFVLSAFLEMSSDVDCFLDQGVDVFRDFRGGT